jgi:predicted transcriptional regulator
MKSYFQLRELTGRRPEGQLVVNKKLGRIRVMIYKERNGFVAYVDGDRLDRYRTKQEAEKAVTEIIKVLKK